MPHISRHFYIAIYYRNEMKRSTATSKHNFGVNAYGPIDLRNDYRIGHKELPGHSTADMAAAHWENKVSLVVVIYVASAQTSQWAFQAQ